jgi:hypothetical protein
VSTRRCLFVSDLNLYWAPPGVNKPTISSPLMPLAGLTSITHGHADSIWESKAASEADPEKCFSVCSQYHVAAHTLLHIECSSAQEVRVWIRALGHIIRGHNQLLAPCAFAQHVQTVNYRSTSVTSGTSLELNVSSMPTDASTLLRARRAGNSASVNPSTSARRSRVLTQYTVLASRQLGGDDVARSVASIRLGLECRLYEAAASPDGTARGSGM